MDQDDRIHATGGRIGLADVRRIEARSRHGRMLDYRYGGGAGKNIVLRELRDAGAMLSAPATEQVRARLYTAVADVHNLFGWILFDVGEIPESDACFSRALELARAGDNAGLLADIHYRIGRIHLHHGDPARAVSEFQRGTAFARQSGSALAAAILSVNEAWANAIMGRIDETLRLLGAAFDAFTKADPAKTPPWAAFFDETDLSATTGVVYTELAQRVNRSYTPFAIQALTTAVNSYSEAMTRSRTFALICLAISHFIEGDTDQATKTGTQAVEVATGLSSGRVIDRIRPLRAQARRLHGNSDARDLIERISQLTGDGPHPAE